MSDDKPISLSEIEKKLHDAMDAIEVLKKGDNVAIGDSSIVKQYEELKKKYEQKSAEIGRAHV